MKPIYLDHNTTTPIEPDVLKAMLPYLQDEFGSPTSAHAAGKRARDAIENARAQVAALIGAKPDEIVFTGSGTESINTAIRNGAKLTPGRKRVVTTSIEHPTTDACCALLQKDDFDIRRVAPQRNGIVRADDFKSHIDASTALVTVIHAQNEIGTLQPITEIAAIAKSDDALLHADAAQSVSKVPVDVTALGVDLLSISGHKLYAPKGIGALFVRNGITLPSILAGAGQEHGRRPGTENVPYIVGLGEACRIAGMKLESSAKNMRMLSDQLFSKLKGYIPGIVVIGGAERRLPNTLNVIFPEIAGHQLLRECPQVLASSGSTAIREEASKILIAIGLPEHIALGAVCLSLGRHTTPQDVDAAAAYLVAAWHQLSQSN